MLRTARWKEVNIMKGRSKKWGKPKLHSITGTLNLASIQNFSGIYILKNLIWLKPIETGFSGFLSL